MSAFAIRHAADIAGVDLQGMGGSGHRRDRKIVVNRHFLQDLSNPRSNFAFQASVDLLNVHTNDRRRQRSSARKGVEQELARQVVGHDTGVSSLQPRPLRWVRSGRASANGLNEAGW